MTCVQTCASSSRTSARLRTRWAAAGAAIAVTLGAGGLSIAGAADDPSTDYRPVEPCRLVDTRASSVIGDHATPIGPGETRTFAARGAVGECELPADTVALSINLASVDASTRTFFTAHSAGSTRPTSSQLNPNDIVPVTANGFDVALSADGEFSVYNSSGTSHMLIDVLGVYTGSEPLVPVNGTDGQDGADAPALAAFYADTDDDGFGDPDNFDFAYEQPTGFVTNKLDCDDTTDTINPERVEVVFDDLDSDCDDDGGGALARISLDTVSGSHNPVLNSDGQFVAFESGDSGLVDDDNNDHDDVFLVDTATSETTRVSVSTDGTEADRDSGNPHISSDGRYVVFESTARNLVTGDTNDETDIFVHDTDDGVTTRVSVATGGVEADDSSFDPQISGNGRYVVFTSNATNLVTGDTNDERDVFIHDTETGTTTRVSVGPGNTDPDDGSSDPTISYDGAFVAFESSASNLVVGDNNDDTNVFITNIGTGMTAMIGVGELGDSDQAVTSNPSISADGTAIAFRASFGGPSQILVALESGLTTLVSAASDGSPANAAADRASISSDGRYVAFDSAASNLLENGTSGPVGEDKVFVKDLSTSVVYHVSASPDGSSPDGESADPWISGDGRFVVFESDSSNLAGSDLNGTDDVFLADLGAAPVS